MTNACRDDDFPEFSSSLETASVRGTKWHIHASGPFLYSLTIWLQNLAPFQSLSGLKHFLLWISTNLKHLAILLNGLFTRTCLSYLSFCNHRPELNCRACPVHFLVEIKSEIQLAVQNWASTNTAAVTLKNSTMPKTQENEAWTSKNTKVYFLSTVWVPQMSLQVLRSWK